MVPGRGTAHPVVGVNRLCVCDDPLHAAHLFVLRGDSLDVLRESPARVSSCFSHDLGHVERRDGVPGIPRLLILHFADQFIANDLQHQQSLNRRSPVESFSRFVAADRRWRSIRSPTELRCLVPESFPARA